MKDFFKNLWIIASLLVIVGLTLLIIGIKCCTQGTFWYSVFGNASSALLICGVISLLQEAFTKKDTIRTLTELFKISSAIKDSGITDVQIDSESYSFKGILSSSECFYGILNDGLRWTERYSCDLISRFNRAGTKTEFYFVDPYGKFCPALAQKTEKEENALQAKILQTVDLLQDLYNKRSEKKGELTVYFLKNYPTQSIFYTEKTIVTTLYQTACGRNTVPVFEYKYDKTSTNIAKYLYKDLDNVRGESTVVIKNDKRILEIQ